MRDGTIPAGAVARLRQATGAAHVHLEERLERSAFTMDAVPYRKLVAAFLGFFDPVERRLLERGDFDAEDYTFHQKSPWLRADLVTLGLSRNEIADLPRCAKLPQVGSPAAAFGCTYVLEGATLGGRVILRRLSEDVASPDARRFFSPTERTFRFGGGRFCERWSNLPHARAVSPRWPWRRCRRFSVWVSGSKTADLWMSETLRAPRTCDNEAVHRSGAIQPHGTLWVVEDSLTRCRAVAANCGEWLRDGGRCAAVSGGRIHPAPDQADGCAATHRSAAFPRAE